MEELLCPCPIGAAVWFACRDISRSRRGRQRTRAHRRHCGAGSAQWKEADLSFPFALQDRLLDRISFKGTVDASRQYSIAIAQGRSKKRQQELVSELLKIIASDQVPDRPGRCEPRAVKRRPKPYQLLNRPRHSMKELQHRNKYRKKPP